MPESLIIFLIFCFSILGVLFFISLFFVFNTVKKWYFDNREKAFLQPRPNQRYYFYKWTKEIFWKGVFPFSILTPNHRNLVKRS